MGTMRGEIEILIIIIITQNKIINDMIMESIIIIGIIKGEVYNIKSGHESRMS